MFSIQAVLRQAGGHAQLQLSVRGRLQQPTIVELQRPRLHRNARTSYATIPVSRIFHACGDNPFFRYLRAREIYGWPARLMQLLKKQVRLCT